MLHVYAHAMEQNLQHPAHLVAIVEIPMSWWILAIICELYRKGVIVIAVRNAFIDYRRSYFRKEKQRLLRPAWLRNHN